jgi:hypothetical protein
VANRGAGRSDAVGGSRRGPSKDGRAVPFLLAVLIAPAVGDQFLGGPRPAEDRHRRAERRHPLDRVEDLADARAPPGGRRGDLVRKQLLARALRDWAETATGFFG